jgi:hypothetical protein
MRQLVQDNYLTHAVRTYGATGSKAVRSLLELIARLYEARDPENITGPLVLFSTMKTGKNLMRGPATQYVSIDALAQDFATPIVIELLENGSVRAWHGEVVNHYRLSKVAIVYHFESRTDAFFVSGTRIEVPKLYPPAASQFSQPRFRKLSEALERYKIEMVRKSRCPEFSRVWKDARRLYLRQKPEHYMRSSLEAFLVASLSAEAEVRPEHNVDESKPVDIRVYWNLGNQESLIEIKWLGVSKAGARVTTRYTEVRAREGAEQLADYLDRADVRVGAVEMRGTLVVFDARRALPKSRKITRAEAFKYEHKEISYLPDYSKTRGDFDAPVRLFAEPKV